MIAYNFRPEFAADIVAGGKHLTMCRPRKHPSRHANVGEAIGLWTGQRTKDARRRGVGLVTLRGLLFFSARGIVELSDLQTIDPPDLMAADLEADLRGRELDCFARRDGFENWQSLWNWHANHRTEREIQGAHALCRELIVWRPLNAEQIAAADRGELQAVA